MKDAIVSIAGYVLLAAGITSPVACTMNRHVLIADAVQSGADPIAVRCALESSVDQSAMCIAKALQQPTKVNNARTP